MIQIKEKYLQSWQAAYNQLNEKQKLAVDTLEGPVMTIAGPGTGKTQLLAVRIGNILMHTDVFPHNILCLTYTDQGANAMRQRLESFIGPDAYNVNIHTFHAFCNSVIKENMQYFGDFRDLQQVSDLEEASILRNLIDGFSDDHPLKRLKRDEYFEVKRLKNLFTLMKQEKWSPEYIQAAYEEYKSFLFDPERSPYVYVKKYTDTKTGQVYQAGDLKMKSISSELDKYINTVAAAAELPNYNQLMRKNERYDYQDMILWVIDKFKQHDELVAKYQEKYQYILVDEYQDTNGAQNDLLFTLADYWEKPNLFIVGDDDQSIFRFQGANMNSILDFKEKYEPNEIVLTDNYRSSQKILDRAKMLIENNEERLVKKYSYLTKELTEARKVKNSFSPDPFIISYLNKAQEEVGVIKKIQQLHESGVPYKDIAVIYTKHSTAENLIRYFSQKKIPINVKKRVNALFENEVYRITKILEYLHDEFTRPHSREDILFEMLHYDFFGLSALDIAALSIYCRKKSDHEENIYLNWREVIRDEQQLTKAGVKDVQLFCKISAVIEQWITDIPNVTIQTLLEKVITESNMLHSILSDPDKVWKLQLVNTFFDYVKNEASKVRQLTLKHLLEMVDLMRETNIELPLYRIISNENGINFLTAHGAKGLEFDHVFMIHCTADMWESKKGSNNSFAIIPTLTATTKENSIEDERRLFYVAMTRAREYLYISYPQQNNEEKNINLSQFIAEIKLDGSEVEYVKIEDDELLAYKAELMKYQKGEPNLIDDELIDRVLQNFKMSVTSLNKYLKCKLAFYFENILRIPIGRSVSMGFGNAIHYALEQFFRDIEISNPRSTASLAKMITFFEKGMDKYKSHFTSQEFDNHIKHGTQVLTDYYNKYAGTWLQPAKYELEYNIPTTEYRGVPISGKLDRIDVFHDHISVTDYKTGKYETNKTKLNPPKDEEDPGGDYWRQISFYHILLEGDKRNTWKMAKGVMDFVEKDKKTGEMTQKEFYINMKDVEVVGQQIVYTYDGIKKHIFTPGCDKKDCQWCNFVLRNMPVKSLTTDEEADQNISEMDNIY
jgi:DNA helicase-2/ATP-dependent DNA helicase PcrA